MYGIDEEEARTATCVIDDEREATKGPGAVMSGSMAHFDYFDTCSDEHEAKHKCNDEHKTRPRCSYDEREARHSEVGLVMRMSGRHGRLRCGRCVVSGKQGIGGAMNGNQSAGVMMRGKQCKSAMSMAQARKCRRA